jgi:cation-transporting P-type ATPase C
MNNPSALRVAPGVDGVSIWSSEIFGDPAGSSVRDFLARAFSVKEVEGVELQRATSRGRICHAAVANPAQILKKLSRALRSVDGASPISGVWDRPAQRIDAGFVYLDGPQAAVVRVSRIGNALTTWRVRHHSDRTLLLWHPSLRNRRDVVFRLEEELAAIFGIEAFSASALTGAVSIRFDKSALTLERLIKQLEKTWPRLLKGLDGPPSRKRFVAAVGLLGLAFTGQYLVPAVRRFAVAGVVIYSFPNVVAAVKQLRRGEVGLSALYTTGLGLMLIGGMPFASTVFAVLMQFWPHLSRHKVVSSQRRLFAGQRRRPVWVRIAQVDGVDVEAHVDDLRQGDLIVVRRSEIVPVDGVVESGSAVVDEAPFGGGQLEDKSQGDPVAAGAFVHDGNLTIKVERVGTQTSASYIDSLLPHTLIAGLPSSQEAERIANRNAKPVLLLSAVTLGIARTLRPAQALIRPDYATGPRLSAQLSALQGIAYGLRHGVLFRNPAALDRIAVAEIYVIDESAGLDRRSIEVAKVETVSGVAAELVVSYVLAAHRTSGSERSRALARFASSHAIVQPNVASLSRHAGITRYRDGTGSTIEIATEWHLTAAKVDVPKRFQRSPVRRSEAPARRVATDTAGEQPSVRPLWVLRDGKVIGQVSFARSGELIGKEVVAALKTQKPQARIAYLSRGAQADADALAGKLGIEFAYGGVNQAAKADLIRGLGHKTLWIGDGSDPQARESIVASTVSVSVAALTHVHQDAADIQLPQRALLGLPLLMDIARAHATRLAQDWRTVYSTNLLGVAGAFGARFGSLQAGLLSHVGTGLIYIRRARQLDRMASAVDKRRAQLRRAGSA